MKAIVLAAVLVSSFVFGASDLGSKEPKWDLLDRPVDNYMILSAFNLGDKQIPPVVRVELAEKSKSVMISICGPEISVEVGSGLPENAIGTLSVQNLDKLGWFGPVSQVINGKVILRVEVGAVKEDLDTQIGELRSRYSCRMS